MVPVDLSMGILWEMIHHGARPHLGANAIEIGATLDQILKTIHIIPLYHHLLNAN